MVDGISVDHDVCITQESVMSQGSIAILRCTYIKFVLQDLVLHLAPYFELNYIFM